MRFTLFLTIFLLTYLCEAQSNDSRVIKTRIIKISEDWFGRFTYEMQNGQVWKSKDEQERDVNNNLFTNKEVIIYQKDCSWVMNLISLNQPVNVYQVDVSYINNQLNLHEQIRGGKIYFVYKNKLIVKKGDYFYLMSILPGECPTMGAMNFNETNYNYQFVFIKEYPDQIGIGFEMKIIKKSKDYNQLEKMI